LVHIAYGFGGIRRLDLEAGTNSDGKVKFTGLLARVHRPPLEFRASKDEFEDIAAYDPSTECQALFSSQFLFFQIVGREGPMVGSTNDRDWLLYQNMCFWVARQSTLHPCRFKHLRTCC
jgi:hypothetical protein